MAGGSIPSPPPADAVAGQTYAHISYHNMLAATAAGLVTAVGGLPNLLWGSATLVDGQAVVSCGEIASGSLIFLSRMLPSGTPGHLMVAAITPAVSFTIASSSAGEASSVAYLIIP